MIWYTLDWHKLASTLCKLEGHVTPVGEHHLLGPDQQVRGSEGQKAATSDLRVLWFALWILTCHFSALFSSTLLAREEQYLGQTIELLTQSNQVNSWDHRPYIGPSRRLRFHRQGKLRHGQALNGHTWAGNQSLSGDQTLGWIPPQLPKWL